MTDSPKSHENDPLELLVIFGKLHELTMEPKGCIDLSDLHLHTDKVNFSIQLKDRKVAHAVRTMDELTTLLASYNFQLL